MCSTGDIGNLSTRISNSLLLRLIFLLFCSKRCLDSVLISEPYVRKGKTQERNFSSLSERTGFRRKSSLSAECTLSDTIFAPSPLLPFLSIFFIFESCVGQKFFLILFLTGTGTSVKKMAESRRRGTYFLLGTFLCQISSAIFLRGFLAVGQTGCFSAGKLPARSEEWCFK